MARDELRLTLEVEYLGQSGDRTPIIREQADCGDLFALCHEWRHVTGPRFEAAISEAFMAGTREIKEPR